MTRPAILLALAVLALTFGCGGGGGGSTFNPGPGPEPNPRPETAPDFVLLTVSGHVGVISAINCTSEDNRSYLDDPGEAAEALRDFFTANGFELYEQHYADLLDHDDVNGDGVADDPDRLGFLDLLAELDWIYLNWIADYDDPTKIVLVAHSHGTNWAHIAASIRPEIPIAYLVTLDGICFYWDCEHGDAMDDWMAASGETFPYDLSAPCDALGIPGQPDPLSAKDVAFGSVAVNLEVRSDDLLLSDCCRNYRPNGSRAGIFTYDSDESHSAVTLADSDSLAWVIERIRELEGVGTE
jgi:hypothetical protein